MSWRARVLGVLISVAALLLLIAGEWVLTLVWHAENQDYQALALIGLFCLGLFAALGTGVAVATKLDK